MGKYQLIAATGCPTGIAHTYMAQEALEQAARKKGITIKVETHGQIGIENELTAEEIKQADAVIIAADKDVHSERFAGKRVIDVSVSTGIKDAQRLIDGTGFLVGILAGFLAGYFILFLQKLLTILPKQLDGLKAIFLYPVIGVVFIGIVMSLLAGPMKAINE